MQLYTKQVYIFHIILSCFPYLMRYLNAGASTVSTNNCTYHTA